MSHPCPSVNARLVSALLLLLLIAGCETAQKAGGRLDSALGHYDAQRYQLAHQHSVEALRTPGATTEQREQAAYLAGLSAFRNGDLNEAELRLGSIMSLGPAGRGQATSNRLLLGSAQAMMGQIRMEQSRPAEAAVYFEHAARSLTGEDSRQAQRYAAMAHHEAGNKQAAERLFESAGPVATPTGSGGGAGFTIQAGAFQDRRRAEQAASDIAELARRYGYGPVNIRQSADSRGRTLYLVQFGRFPTRQAAAQARSTLGRLEYIVATLPQS